MVASSRTLLTRRTFLARAASATALATTETIAKPYLSYAASRPQITHGIQSGDVSTDSAVVWARADRPSRMVVEAATTDSFKDIRSAVAIDALPESDFTGKALLESLPAGQDIFYRVRFEDLAAPTISSEAQVGRFRTAPGDARSVSFVWSGDTAGQGWGIDEARGGMRSYATMLKNRPDFFIHSGDSIYADCPIERELKLPNGEVWKNIVTEEKAHIAKSVADFRGNYQYNLLDANMRRFNAEVPVFAQWDDHEVANDWWPGQDRSDYGHTNASLLAAHGRRAFCEYMPVRQTQAETGRIYRRIAYGPLLDVFMLDMRSYRGPNDKAEATMGPECRILGVAQCEWLKRELSHSKATWKIIAADMPLSVVSHDAVAQGDGEPAGREHEIAEILGFIKHAGVRNTVWITADMHYTAAHYYDPNRAVFQDFEPFWEFISGPLHAGTWGPGELDNTFGPQVMYQNGCSAEQGENLAPCFGLQFFGHVEIDGATEVMTVTLKDVNDRNLWSTRIEPKLLRWTRGPNVRRI
ncbi:MAG: alkaline phosphatase D family protein [Xanthobacteraceae bacterium]|nr:alkaline phosphatase D family protein [Xanthobacteraceae bacterium]